MKIDSLVLASRNKNKITEIHSIFGTYPVALKTLDDWQDSPEVEETGETLEDNAILKARTIAAFTNQWAFADDSGLEVDALGGSPGVTSARFAGERCSYDANNKKLLELMEGIPDNERTARFRCVIALSSPQKKIWTVQGVLEGYIAAAPKGSNGFGYDPVFIDDASGKHLAEMTIDEKNHISHRGQALKNLLKLLISLQDI